MKNYTFASMAAIALLALTSEASYAGYNGGQWASKASFVKITDNVQCVKTSTASNCNTCIGDGKSQLVTTVVGTKGTIQANLSAEAQAKVSASVWKFAAFDASYTGAVNVGGSYSFDSTTTRYRPLGCC